jgi:hypothetical protein
MIKRMNGDTRGDRVLWNLIVSMTNGDKRLGHKEKPAQVVISPEVIAKMALVKRPRARKIARAMIVRS